MMDKDRAELIAQWVEATDRAISALIDWRARLTTWGNGGPSSRDDLDQAFDLLTSAGLGEWAEWAPAAGGLDALAELIGPSLADLERRGAEVLADLEAGRPDINLTLT